MVGTRQFTLIVALSCGLSALGQTPASGGIDPGLLAKANAGDVASQLALGEAYSDGKGVTRDYKQAAEWFQRAAEKNNVDAEMRLAALYRDGSKNFPRDMQKAADWYRKAADQGDATAQGTLGTLYSMGQGVPQSYVEAYYWLDLAAAVKGPRQGQYAANRQMMGEHITADELADVQDRETKWKAAHPRSEAAQ